MLLLLPRHDNHLSDRSGEPRRVRRSKQYVRRYKDKYGAATTAKKSKTNTALLEVKRRVVFLLLGTDELGLRLLLTLRAHHLLSTSELIGLVPNAGVDSVAPALVGLKRSGLVSLQDDRFSCTDAGGELLRRIEKVAGKRLDTGLDQAETCAVVRYAVRRVLLSREGSEMNRSQAAAAPAPEFVKGYDEAMNDPNYRAYLAERTELEASGEELLVAYSGGKKIAEAKTMGRSLSSDRTERRERRGAHSGCTGESNKLPPAVSCCSLTIRDGLSSADSPASSQFSYALQHYLHPCLPRGHNPHYI